MSFIKLTSFESWTSAMDARKSIRGCPPDLLINTDHVLRVVTQPARTTPTRTIIGGKLYTPTLLIFVDKVVKVVESPDYIKETSRWAADGSAAEPFRKEDSYVKGVRCDDYGNSIEEESAAQQ